MKERVVQRVVAALVAGAVVVGLGLLGVALNVAGSVGVQRWIPGLQVDITCGYGDVASLPPFTVPCPTVITTEPIGGR